MAFNSGYTLIEVLITVTIITLVTTIGITALPLVRDSQNLRLAEQELQSKLRVAGKKALHENRDQRCLDDPRVETPSACSDIGLAVTSNLLILFADINQDLNYSSGADLILEEVPLPNQVRALTDTVFLFVAEPPALQLYQDGVPLLSDDQPGEITLLASSRESQLTISPFAYVNRIE
jgi:prepilin-type N-terminal cleavage/methylation domain-containing protein